MVCKTRYDVYSPLFQFGYDTILFTITNTANNEKFVNSVLVIATIVA